jgi:hypothetical protein
MLITGPCVEATRALFADSSNGFNSIVNSLGHSELAIDWAPDTSIQFFEANLHPLDLEESSDFKYPVAFLHGTASTNTHDQFGTDFSGSVTLSLRIYASSRAAKASKAARALEILGNVVESAVNKLLADNQWPQTFGISSGVCGSWPMAREAVAAAGENWRQGYIFRLSIELTTA